MQTASTRIGDVTWAARSSRIRPVPLRPIAQKLAIPDRLVTFQVMRRSLGTHLQDHGTLKDTPRRATPCQHYDDRQRVRAGGRGERDVGRQLSRHGCTGWLDAGGRGSRAEGTQYQKRAGGNENHARFYGNLTKFLEGVLEVIDKYGS